MVVGNVVDMLLLRGIRGGHENALAQIIDKYTGYVCVIIRNAVGAALTREDIEEVASDVFLALWNNADKAEKLKAYIAATARNKAKNKLREVTDNLPLDESIIADSVMTLDEALISEDERRMVKSAVLGMEDTDREIFLRYYYRSQTVSEISRETGISESTVKKRLSRGRAKLKEVFGQ